jgi:hypothetical protein
VREVDAGVVRKCVDFLLHRERPAP